jgi:hypothetical protein
MGTKINAYLLRMRQSRLRILTYSLPLKNFPLLPKKAVFPARFQVIFPSSNDLVHFFTQFMEIFI